MKHLLLATALALAPVAAKAETCSGTFTHRSDGWFITSENGQLCTFRDGAMVDRVRAVCFAEKDCKVTGTIIDCKHDACREIKSIQRVEKIK